jgi:hypothetical protein
LRMAHRPATGPRQKTVEAVRCRESSQHPC